MAERKVFGRIKLRVGDEKWRIELRPDGLHVRKKHYRREWIFTPEQIVRLSKSQTELFTYSETIGKKEGTCVVLESQKKIPAPSAASQAGA